VPSCKERKGFKDTVRQRPCVPVLTSDTDYELYVGLFLNYEITEPSKSSS